MPKMITDTRGGAFMMSRSDIVPGADNRTVIQNICAAAAASTGIREVILPPGKITVGAQSLIPATAHGLTIRGHGDDTVIEQIAGAVNKAIFYGAGTDGAKVALTGDLGAGSSTLTIPIEVASTLIVGSQLGLECATVVYGIGTVSQESYASEIHKVTSVSGTTVTIDAPLLHDHTVASGAVAWKMSPLMGVTLKDMVLTSTDPLNVKARNIMFEKVQGLRIQNVRVRNSGGGIYLTDAIDAVLSNIEIDGLPNVTSHLGYGVAVGGRSAHTYIDNLRGRNVRHLFTTLADERVSGTTTQWGGPRHVTIRGGVGEQAKTGTHYAIWDTHPYGNDIVFDHCRAYGGSGSSGHGFQMRAKNIRLINPVSMRPGAQGIRVDPATAENVEIIGGEVGHAPSGGIGLGVNTTVRGVYIHDNSVAGVTIGDTATRSHVSGCRIENNTTGLHDQSTGGHSGVAVIGNIIPKSATQSIAITSPKSNLVYASNVALGYGAGNDGVGGSPAATIKKVGNITD